MSKTKFWWDDDPDAGVYHFCYNEDGGSNFDISEVSVRFAYDWTDKERRRRFKGAKFIFGGCASGVSYSNHLLKAETIEEAKKEFEAWYEQYLSCRIETMKGFLAVALEDYERFLLYKKED